jgi:hydrogenase maturation factor
MCQGFVGKVKSTGKGLLVVEYKGRSVELRSNLQQVIRGDYVLFASGIALDRVDAEEALAVLGASE